MIISETRSRSSGHGPVLCETAGSDSGGFAGSLDTLQALRDEFAARGTLAAVISFGRTRPEIWSFAQLAETSARFAAGLRRRSLGAGEGVALIAPNSPRWLAAFWGIQAAGTIAVPLDSQNDDRELARMIEIGRCSLAVTTAALASRLHVIAPSCRLVILDTEEAPAPDESWSDFLGQANVPQKKAIPTDTAVIVFTSGTTGNPKAVPLTHANLLTNVRALAATRLVGPGDRAVLPLPFYHAYPLTIGLIVPLALGCAAILPGGISGPELLTALRDGGATVLVGVPRLYIALLDAVRRGIAGQPRFVASVSRVAWFLALRAMRHGVSWLGHVFLAPLRRQIAPRLRLLVSGGAAVPLEVEEALSALGWEMLTGYGLVETSSMLTFNPPGAARVGSAGRPVPGMQLRITNQSGDGIGEIETRGPSLFGGYTGDPEKTAAAFTVDGWFRTGDLGRIDRDGFLHIAARKTETIVLADGKKLFPEPFEVIYAGSPLVREAALLGVNGALVALVVPDLTAARDAGAMRLADALHDSLTATARTLPSHARLSGFAITRQSLPRTQLGKIRRHLLPALYATALRHESATPPTPLSAEDRRLIEEPRGALLWQWLQKRFPDHPLSFDSVLQLDLGIDSLSWVELTLALQREIGVTLREKEIARIVTIRDLLREAADAPEGVPEAIETARQWLAPLALGYRCLRAFGEPLIRGTMRLAFHLRVEGVDRLPVEGPILLCPNHVSYLDPFAVAIALPRAYLRRTCWSGWTGVAFSTRLRRLFSRAARILPVDPDRAAASGLAVGRAALDQGFNLVWFPEGARSADGKLQRFLPGIGALVEQQAVPIVPIYIEGSFAAWPVGQRLPRFMPITVHFGSPILPASISSDVAGRAREERIAAAVRTAVAALAR